MTSDGASEKLQTLLSGAGASRLRRRSARPWRRLLLESQLHVHHCCCPLSRAVMMVSGPPLFRRFSGAWLFRPLTADRTRVTFRYHFTTRPRALSPLLDPFVRRVLQREMQARLAGLKTSSETTDILRRLPAR
ncbi:MAG: hypothetical protein HYX51_11595 [Chloroflexi bacterium]|nr:hypothetical protein [Chloroflexota bacterium]